MKSRILTSLLGFLFLNASAAFGAYTVQRIDGGPNNLVQGKDYTYLLTSSPADFDDVRIEVDAPATISVSPGVQSGPNTYRMDPLGQLSFTIRFNQPGSHSMTFTDTTNASLFTSVDPVNVQRYPDRFSITPSPPTIQAGVPNNLNIQITALDGGSVVTYFDNSVQVTETFLGAPLGVVDASAFVNGVANATLQLNYGNTLNQNQLEITLAGGFQYTDPSGSPVPPATSLHPVGIIPAAFNKLLMTFPGEVLTPGQGTFKDSSGILDIEAGVPVSVVEVRRIDAFGNPILTNPPVPLDVFFTISDPSETPPQNQTMNTALLSLEALDPPADRFQFDFPGTKDVTANVVGNPSASDSSSVNVTPGAVQSYTITVNNWPASAHTTTPISLTIEAFGPGGVPLTSLQGVLPGSRLEAEINAPGGEQRADWIDTNTGDSPQAPFTNVVSFTDGVANVNLNVTKQNSSVRIHFIDADGNSAFTPINSINTGPASLIHFTIVGIDGPLPTGELYTPGSYPGNSGVPPAVSADQELILEARVTDARWNLVSDPANVGETMELIDDLPDIYIDSRHVSIGGSIFNLPLNGEYGWDPNPAFDNSFRVQIRSAGPAQTIRGVSTIGAAGDYFSSPVQVLPTTYARLVIEAPGETLRPGTDAFADGKEFNPTTQPVGQQFGARIYAVDQFFNPTDPPYPQINFNIADPNGFPTEPTPIQMSANSRVVNFILTTDSTIEVYEVGTPSIKDIVSIPTSFGQIDNFVLLVDATNQPYDESDYEAGEFTRVRIEAHDEFTNVVQNYTGRVNLLAINSGAGTMEVDDAGTIIRNPEYIDINAGDNGAKVFDLRVFAAGDNQIRMSQGGIVSLTDIFNVRVNDGGYENLVLIVDGETHVGGLIDTNGKIGTPNPVTAGQAITITAYATDQYFNRLSVNPGETVQFETDVVNNNFVEFLENPINRPIFNESSTLLGVAQISLVPRTAAIQVLTVTDSNTPSITSSSNLQVLPANYTRLQIIAPGEVPIPGSFLPDGKDSTQIIGGTAQEAVATPFTVEIRAVDEFWNIVPSVSGNTDLTGRDIRVHTAIQESVFIPANNVDTPGSDPRRFSNGVAFRDVIIGVAGTDIEIFADDDITIDGLKATGRTAVNVAVGPQYNFVLPTPAQATAGVDFQVTVQLLDTGGNPVPNYNEPVFLTAVFVDNNPSRGDFSWPSGGVAMSNGELTVDLNYIYVETIKIQLTDNFGRMAFSSPITILPSGLRYEVVAPNQATVGPPGFFDVTVRLVDFNEGTLISDPLYNHSFDVDVVAPGTTLGNFTFTQGQMLNGDITFQQSYTKAEPVVVEVRERADIDGGLPGFVISTGNSQVVNMKPAQFEKLLLIAPGELHNPGVPNDLDGSVADGKVSELNPAIEDQTPASQQVGIPFQVEVLAADQYWNHVTEGFDFSTTNIEYRSFDNPASLNTTTPNPPDQNTPLSSTGQKASVLTLFNSGNTTVRVFDPTNSNIGSQEIIINVGGVEYQIAVPSQVFAGPSTPFAMTITLIDTLTGLKVDDANLPITIEALPENSSHTPGTLGVVNANLVAGQVAILNQSYTKPHDVRFRITDTVGNVGTSDIVRVISRAITYQFDTPAQAIVNTNFSFTIRAVDAFTGEDNTVIDARDITLEARSIANNGNPVTGTFFPLIATINNGRAQIDTAQYNIAESIFLVLTDTTDPTDPNGQPPTNPTFQSAAIDVTEGPVDEVIVSNFAMQSNQIRNITILFEDISNNLIPDNTIRLRVNSINPSGTMFINGQANEFIGKTNSAGELAVTFRPVTTTNGPVEVLITDLDVPNGKTHTLTIDVLGLNVPPASAAPLLGNRIPINSFFKIPDSDIPTITAANSVLTIFYSVDGSPYVEYDRANGIVADDPVRGFPVFNELRSYEIRWFTEVCYTNLDPNCDNPIKSLDINGGPNIFAVSTYDVDGKLAGFPSPFNPKTSPGVISLIYPLPVVSSVEIDIYDLFGRKVKHIDVAAGQEGGLAKLDNIITWDGRNEDGVTVASGGYIVYLQIGATGTTMKTKIMVVK